MSQDVTNVADFWEKRLREYLEKQKGWVAEALLRRAFPEPTRTLLGAGSYDGNSYRVCAWMYIDITACMHAYVRTYMHRYIHIQHMYRHLYIHT